MTASRDWFEKDFYAILGVSQTATPEEIKRAFKKLARELHPDRNPEPTAESRFKDVTEANEVLSDPERRREYDEVRRLARQGYAGGRPGAGFRSSGIGFDDIPVDLGDIFGGLFRGGGRRQAPNHTPSPPPPPAEDRRTVRVPFHLAALGGQIRVQTPSGLVTMKVSAGTQSGTELRLRERGTFREDGSPRDVIVRIEVTIPTELDEEERVLMEGLRARDTARRRSAKESAT